MNSNRKKKDERADLTSYKKKNGEKYIILSEKNAYDKYPRENILN